MGYPSTVDTGQVMPAIIANDESVLVAPITTTLVANTVYLRALTLLTSTTIVAIGCYMGATDTGKTNMGIYTLAGALVAGSDTGQITNIAGNLKTVYGTAITLAPGQYFIALSPSNSTDTYASRSSAVNSTASSYRTATNTLSAGALPATTGAFNTTILEVVAALYTQNGLT